MSTVTIEKTGRTFMLTTAPHRALALIRRACTNRQREHRAHPSALHRARLHLLPLSLITRPCTSTSTIDRMGRTFMNTSAVRRALLTRLSARLRENPSIRQPLLWKRPLSLPPPLLLSLPKRLPRTVIHLRQALSETPTDGLNGANLRNMNLCERPGTHMAGPAMLSITSSR